MLTVLIQVSAGKVIRSGDTWHYSFHHLVIIIVKPGCYRNIIESCVAEVEHSNVTVVCSDTFFDLGIVENIIAA